MSGCVPRKSNPWRTFAPATFVPPPTSRKLNEGSPIMRGGTSAVVNVRTSETTSAPSASVPFTRHQYFVPSLRNFGRIAADSFASRSSTSGFSKPGVSENSARRPESAPSAVHENGLHSRSSALLRSLRSFVKSLKSKNP